MKSKPTTFVVLVCLEFPNTRRYDLVRLSSLAARLEEAGVTFEQVADRSIEGDSGIDGFRIELQHPQLLKIPSEFHISTSTSQ